MPFGDALIKDLRESYREMDVTSASRGFDKTAHAVSSVSRAGDELRKLLGGALPSVPECLSKSGTAVPCNVLSIAP